MYEALTSYDYWYTLPQLNGKRVLLKRSGIISVEELERCTVVRYQCNNSYIEYEIDMKFEDLHKQLFSKVT